MTPKTSPSVCAEAPTLFPSEAPIERTHADKAVLSVSEQEERTTGKVLSCSMSLFEIDESLSALMESAVEAAIENNNEIPAEMHQALLDYCETFGEKVDNVARYIRSLEFEARNAKTEIDRLEQRKAAAEHRVERMKGLLKYFMESRNIRSMKGGLNTISLRKNSQDSLVLNDTSHLPVEFWRVTLVLNAAEWQELLLLLPENHTFRSRFGNTEAALKREPDSGRIRAALAGGTAVVGAELRRGYHVRLA